MKLSTNNIIAWGKNYTHWLPVIQWVGLITITVILAKTFWVVTLYVSVPDISNEKIKLGAKTTLTSTANKKTDINQLINRHLFGDSNDVPVVENVEETVERETKLNLKLRGIYAANESKRSNAIIEDGKGKQSVYFINDKLSVSGRVYLKQVFMDRVILETNGVKEILRLKDSLPPSLKRAKKTNKIKTSSKNKKKRIDDKRRNRQITKSLSQYKKQLLDDPLSLVGLVNYKPKFVNGEMKGIEISPGKDKRLFTQLGLRRRDVITAINGTSLTSLQDAMGLLGEIRDMQELQVDIE